MSNIVRVAILGDARSLEKAAGESAMAADMSSMAFSGSPRIR